MVVGREREDGDEELTVVVSHPLAFLTPWNAHFPKSVTLHL